MVSLLAASLSRLGVKPSEIFWLHTGRFVGAQLRFLQHTTPLGLLPAAVDKLALPSSEEPAVNNSSGPALTALFRLNSADA